MGNCCGKPSSSSSPFSKPGRTLNDTPAPAPHQGSAGGNTSGSSAQKRAAVPQGVSRPLGGSASNVPDSNDPRSAAARAAEERAAKASATKGKLSEALAQERKQTRTDTLEAASRQERAAREVDEGTKNLQHN